MGPLEYLAALAKIDLCGVIFVGCSQELHSERYMDKIKSIQVIPLIRKLNQVFEGSTYRIVSRNTLYVRIETSDGIVGEAFGGDEDIYQQKVVEIANEFLAPRLIGEELQPVERLWEIMFSTKGLPLHNRSIHTLDMVNHAILMQAIAIIDLAACRT